ncbi:hypothetical protein BH10BDE1_BH10BDE1_23810 [soil metagenome]
MGKFRPAETSLAQIKPDLDGSHQYKRKRPLPKEKPLRIKSLAFRLSTCLALSNHQALS